MIPSGMGGCSAKWPLPVVCNEVHEKAENCEPSDSCNVESSDDVRLTWRNFQLAAKWGRRVSAAIAVLTLSAHARAECVPERAAGPNAECVTLEDGGVRLSDAKADELRKQSLELTTARANLARYAELDKVRQTEAAQLRAVADARKAESEGYRQSAEVATQAYQNAQAALAKQDAWYRQPWFWFAVGLVAGGGGVTAAVVAAH